LTEAPFSSNSRTSSNFPAADARWRAVSPAWFRRLILFNRFAENGELRVGVMDDGCTDSDDPRLDRVDAVDMDDSLERADRTSISSPISSPIERLRFLDAGAVIVVFILASAAAFAFRLPVAGDLEVLLRAVVSLDDEVVVERVWRDGGDRSGDICISCLIAL